jgi:hypothetical protein
LVEAKENFAKADSLKSIYEDYDLFLLAVDEA